MRIHQITATLRYGDAITNNILEIDRRLKAWGFDAHVYAENIEPRVAQICKPDSEYAPFLNETRDLLIYHYSIYTSNLKLYKRSHNRKIVIYHSITPAEFFQGYDSNLETACRLGRLALPNLCGCDLALGVSEFDRRELVAAGIPTERTGVLPIFLGLDKLEEAGLNPSLHQQLTQNGKANLLYVGRLAPNKACQDLIKILYFYREYVNSQVHLWLVGHRSLPAYLQFLEALIAHLGLEDMVTFTDRISLTDLRTYYEACDVFVHASHHEGFGVPLLESMYFDLPVLAHKSTAIPETLGSAGVLFNRLAYAEIAETLELLITDEELRQQIIRRQRQRLNDFAPERIEAKLRQILDRVGAFEMTRRVAKPENVQKSRNLREKLNALGRYIFLQAPKQQQTEYGKVWDELARQDARWNIYATTDEAVFEQGGVADTNRILQWINKESVILDVGCGVGRVERYLAPHCRAIHAVDISQEMLCQARQRLAGVENVFFHRTSATDLSFADDETFDFAFSLLVLQHMEKEDAYLGLCEIYRTLKKGGRASLQFPCLFSDVYSQLFVEYANMETLCVSRVRPYTPDEVKFLLQQVGFTLESQESGVEIVVLVKKE